MTFGEKKDTQLNIEKNDRRNSEGTLRQKETKREKREKRREKREKNREKERKRCPGSIIINLHSVLKKKNYDNWQKCFKSQKVVVILTPRIRDSYCSSSSVTEKPG